MKKIFLFLFGILLCLNLTACGLEMRGDNVASNPPLASNSYFEVHYIDVGQADAALVLCDGGSMLIDGGNASDSNLIAAYLKKLNIETLDYIICSHAHEDHVGGLSGALSVVQVKNVLAPQKMQIQRHMKILKKKPPHRG